MARDSLFMSFYFASEIICNAFKLAFKNSGNVYFLHAKLEAACYVWIHFCQIGSNIGSNAPEKEGILLGKNLKVQAIFGGPTPRLHAILEAIFEAAGLTIGSDFRAALGTLEAKFGPRVRHWKRFFLRSKKICLQFCNYFPKYASYIVCN